MDKKYRVAVGNRIFIAKEKKEDAVEVARMVSTVYTDVFCRVVHKTNWGLWKGTPVYLNGEIINRRD